MAPSKRKRSNEDIAFGPVIGPKVYDIIHIPDCKQFILIKEERYIPENPLVFWFVVRMNGHYGPKQVVGNFIGDPYQNDDANQRLRR